MAIGMEPDSENPSKIAIAVSLEKFGLIVTAVKYIN
jgi:hypothetical protein